MQWPNYCLALRMEPQANVANCKPETARNALLRAGMLLEAHIVSIYNGYERRNYEG